MNNVEKSKQLTAEQIEVMAAFLEGKEIEVQEKSGNSANEIWLPEPAPTWDWHNFNYHVKPEPPKKRIVPYDNAEEFIAAQREHGMYVRERDGLIYMPTTIGNTCVVVGGGSGYSYNILSTEFHFLDGTPCGKEVEV